MSDGFIVMISVTNVSTREEALSKFKTEGAVIGVTQRNLTPAAIPRDQWPGWAKAIATRASPDDKGIGDIAARMIGDEKSAEFKLWFKSTFGKDCGCTGRQREWNRKYPL